MGRRRNNGHNNVEQSEPQINLSGFEGLVLLHDSNPTVLANLQRMCIERLCSNASMIRTLPSLYAMEALVAHSPGSFELVLMDLTKDSEGGMVLAHKLRADNVPVIVTATREAFSPTRFVNLLQARTHPRPTRPSSAVLGSALIDRGWPSFSAVWLVFVPDASSAPASSNACRDRDVRLSRTRLKSPLRVCVVLCMRDVKDQYTRVHLLSAFLRAKDPIDKRERSEFSQ